MNNLKKSTINCFADFLGSFNQTWCDQSWIELIFKY